MSDGVASGSDGGEGSVFAAQSLEKRVILTSARNKINALGRILTGAAGREAASRGALKEIKKTRPA